MSFVKRFAPDKQPVLGNEFFNEARNAILEFELGTDKDGNTVTLSSLAKDREEDSHGTGIDYLSLRTKHGDDKSRWADVKLNGLLQAVDALVNHSLMQNNELVDSSVSYQRAEKLVKQYLEVFPQTIRKLVEGSEATHAVVDVDKYSAAISVEKKASAMLKALDNVFEKYQVGPYAPQQQRGVGTPG